jgi:hypothetical protein
MANGTYNSNLSEICRNLKINSDIAWVRDKLASPLIGYPMMFGKLLR